ncbi:hypothetical protein IM697_05420 [Streptomyces ferrugineus]|uniref:Uncharacterized protein n=1 Tax=Streptomyces ferrugineus TaxID=1413221 RepID=A0A7M2SND2_9ACTN|nr:hypothetical protein [Streptomyces ferrugineus]QOV37856.1 hypothetical protein IM697_05420 [Streptomyces ferrugineus]
MIRDLYNVRLRPAEDAGGAATPMTEEEEQRYRAVLFSEQQQVLVEAEDHCRLRLCLAGYAAS